MKDVTQHAFEVKRNPQFREIKKDEELNAAAQLALIEAGNWDDAICALEQYEKSLIVKCV